VFESSRYCWFHWNICFFCCCKVNVFECCQASMFVPIWCIKSVFFCIFLVKFIVLVSEVDVVWLWMQTDNLLLVQLLIVFGADVNGVNDGKETPRHKAAMRKSTNRLCDLVRTNFLYWLFAVLGFVLGRKSYSRISRFQRYSDHRLTGSNSCNIDHVAA